MAIKIDQKIVGVEVVNESGQQEMVLGPEPMFDESVKRPEKLTGNTYKIPGNDHSIYVTINDIEHESGKRPYEVFIKCDDPNTTEWTSALARILSALLRKGGKFQFVCDELRQVHSPTGGFWSKGKYIPSEVAAIGNAIEQHFIELVYMKERTNEEASNEISTNQSVIKPTGSQCPDCKEFTLVKNDGCVRCTNCGYLGECG